MKLIKQDIEELLKFHIKPGNVIFEGGHSAFTLHFPLLTKQLKHTKIKVPITMNIRMVKLVPLSTIIRAEDILSSVNN